jgi:nucleotide-binding universal stress UspA family protein
MIEIRRILCPIDFSDYSRRALDHAIAIARWYESKITAVHVFSPAPATVYGPGPVVFEPVVLTGVDREELIAATKRFVEAESAPGIPIETIVREGNIAKEILAQAADSDADLLVIGTHGRSGFERLLLGSVTEKVLRRAACPVLTVPRRLPDAAPAGPVLFKRILCPVDFSEPSLHALEYAISMAGEADAHLVLLHVMTLDLESPVGDLPDDEVTIRDFWRRREEELRRSLAAIVPKNIAEYCTVETMLTRGKPGREILRVAGEDQADLIVMGVQGRGAVDLMFFGSTTQHVVRGAACPVLTLRSKGR